MDSNHTIVDMMSTTMQRIREMVDVNTIIGHPILSQDGTTIIPVSKVSFGFTAGGSDFGGKEDRAPNFGGASGAGVTINPIAFLCANQSGVTLLPIGVAPSGTVDRVVEMAPAIMDKIQEMIAKARAKKEPEESAT